MSAALEEAALKVTRATNHRNLPIVLCSDPLNRFSVARALIDESGKLNYGFSDREGGDEAELKCVENMMLLSALLSEHIRAEIAVPA